MKLEIIRLHMAIWDRDLLAVARIMADHFKNPEIARCFNRSGARLRQRIRDRGRPPDVYIRAGGIEYRADRFGLYSLPVPFGGTDDQFDIWVD